MNHTVSRRLLGSMRKGLSLANVCRRAFLREIHDEHVLNGGADVNSKGSLKALKDESTFCSAYGSASVVPALIGEAAVNMLALGDIDPDGGVLVSAGPAPAVEQEPEPARRVGGLSPLVLFINARLHSRKQLSSTGKLTMPEVDDIRL